jgi:hypothetical protein
LVVRVLVGVRGEVREECLGELKLGSDGGDDTRGELGGRGELADAEQAPGELVLGLEWVDVFVADGVADRALFVAFGLDGVEGGLRELWEWFVRIAGGVLRGVSTCGRIVATQREFDLNLL